MPPSYTPPAPATLADVYAGAAASPALVLCGGGPTLARGDLAAAVTTAVAGLRALGVAPGDVVSIVDVNTVRGGRGGRVGRRAAHARIGRRPHWAPGPRSRPAVALA